MKQFYRVFLPLLLCVCCVLPGCAPQVNISSQPKATSGKEQQSTSAVLPTRTPELLGSMKMATAFYKCSQAPSVIRVNIKEASDGMKAALRCLQGLVARTENASIYLSETDYDQFWQDYTAADFGTVFKSVNAMDAFSRYQKLIKGLVIYDEKNEYEYPIAQTMASLLGYLPVTQAVQADLEDVLPKDLPVKSVANAINVTGADADVSDSAGLYVCNTAFYTALHCTRTSPTLTGFIHLPDMPVETAVNAVSAALEHIQRLPCQK